MSADLDSIDKIVLDAYKKRPWDFRKLEPGEPLIVGDVYVAEDRIRYVTGPLHGSPTVKSMLDKFAHGPEAAYYRQYPNKLSGPEAVGELRIRLTKDASPHVIRILANHAHLDMDHYDSKDKQILGLLVHWGLSNQVSQTVFDAWWASAK